MERVYGPYRNRDKWRVVGTGSEGGRVSRVFETEADALAFIGKARQKAGARTVSVGRGEYLEQLERRGARESTRVTAGYRLAGILGPVDRTLLSDLTAKRCQSLYESYASTHKPATHHGALKQARAFGRWCLKQGWAKSNPWEHVETIGVKSHGKPQLRMDDTAKLYAWCVERAVKDDEACAVLVGLVLGLRASEIVGLTGASLDDGGRVVWISKSKTKAGIRPVKLPEVLQEALEIRAKGSKKDVRLLPYSRWWVRAATHRVCAKAGVPRVTAHALRGGGATSALEAGQSPDVVAAWLGQVGTDTLKRSYAQGGAGESARAARTVAKLEELGERMKLRRSPG